MLLSSLRARLSLIPSVKADFDFKSRLKARRFSSNLIELLDEMPKEPVAARQMKKQRLEKLVSDKFKDQAPGHVSVSVLGNGGPGNPKALYIMTDNYRYLFNCGEGCQRLAHEHGQKLAKMDNIFITRPIWENIGGLPGMSMTLQVSVGALMQFNLTIDFQGIGVPAINIHGHPDIVRIYEMTKLFSVTADLLVTEKSLKDGPYSDTVMRVEYVPLTRNSLAAEPFSPKKRAKITDTSDMIMAFACKLHNKPGSLLIDRCMAYGVPKGPLLGKLKAGEDVRLADNKLVRAVDVRAPYEPGPGFIVLECPSVEYIDSIINSEVFSRYQILSDEKGENIASLVVHFTPREVSNDPRYQEWMAKFPPSTFHYSINSSNSSLAYVGAAGLQTKLGLVDDQLFPALHTEIREPEPVTNLLPHKTRTRERYIIRPIAKKGLDPESPVEWDPNTFKNAAAAMDGFTEAVENYKKIIAAAPVEKETYPEIVFFGTASALPGKDRNTSAILVNLDTDTSILLDCGEGTYGQLLRFYGEEQTKQLLINLKAVFISHLHADHHLGLISILQKRGKLTEERLSLICPAANKAWLQDYDANFERICHLFTAFQSETCTKNAEDSVLKKLKLQALKTVRVRHCRDSFGVTLTTATESPFKLVYSGDAMPSDFLVNVGMDCDVLIHEATMEDDLIEEARLKCHSTTSQAIEMGKQMNAKYTILTHFSQRYAKIPIISDKFDNFVGCAFDNMRIRRCDLHRLSHILLPLKCLFRDHYEDMVKKTQKKLVQKEFYLENFAQVREEAKSSTVQQ